MAAIQLRLVSIQLAKQNEATAALQSKLVTMAAIQSKLATVEKEKGHEVHNAVKEAKMIEHHHTKDLLCKERASRKKMKLKLDGAIL